jgi:hypothetical protein
MPKAGKQRLRLRIEPGSEPADSRRRARDGSRRVDDARPTPASDQSPYGADYASRSMSAGCPVQSHLTQGRQAFYRWLRRCQADGSAGLRDGSRRPLHCAHETNSEVVGKIIYLPTNYHFGSSKISLHLRRYHDIEISNSGGAGPAAGRPVPAAAYQCYQRADRKWKRYEKARAGHAVHARRQVHRRDVPDEPEEVVPVHRHRPLHPDPGAAQL